MIDFSTNYLGLKLKNPIVVSASPLTEKLENFERLRDAGASAIVMYSLFEEQIEAESENLDAAMEYGTDSYAESTSYLPDMPKYQIGPDRYLELLHKAKKAVDMPVIASLNGNSRGGWTRYAEYMEEAGADALELNIFNIPTDPSITAEQLEHGYCELVRAVRKAGEDSDLGEARAVLHLAGQLRPGSCRWPGPMAWSSSTASTSPTSIWSNWKSCPTLCSAAHMNCACGCTGPRSCITRSKPTSPSPAASTMRPMC